MVNTRKIKISFHASNITDYSNKQNPPPKYTGVRFHDIHTQIHDREVNKQTHKPYIIT